MSDYTYVCSDCPRNCGALRSADKTGGFCGCFAVPGIVRAAPHFGEEPCISGTGGSGAVFFSGCNLRCAFCQNHEISRSADGVPLDVDKFRDTLKRLRDTGVHNINLVTPTHFSAFLAQALDGLDLGIPIVWNSSGYEKAETLKRLEGLVQIYMPDLKYMDSSLAKQLSGAEDYPSAAAEAISEMLRQRGPYRMDGSGILQSGVLIRHLILPGQAENTMNVIDFVADELERGSVLFSLMGQYTPMPGMERFPELNRRLTENEYADMVSYMHTRHIEDGYTQELGSATEEMIPAFDYTGTVSD